VGFAPTRQWIDTKRCDVYVSGLHVLEPVGAEYPIQAIDLGILRMATGSKDRLTGIKTGVGQLGRRCSVSRVRWSAAGRTDLAPEHDNSTASFHRSSTRSRRAYSRGERN
jgi:hypothetical protein